MSQQMYRMKAKLSISDDMIMKYYMYANYALAIQCNCCIRNMFSLVICGAVCLYYGLLFGISLLFLSWRIPERLFFFPENIGFFKIYANEKNNIFND